MGSKQQAQANSAWAKMAKEKGITRKTGRCGLCEKMVPIPMGSHYVGAACSPRRKK